MALSTIGTNSIADDAVGNTKLDLTANYAFTGTITGAGTFNLLQTITASNDATIAFTSTYLTTTYDLYLIVLNNLQMTVNGADFYINLSTDNGSNYLSTCSYVHTNFYDSTYRISQATSQSNIRIASSVDGTDSSANRGYVSMNIYLNNPNNTTTYKGGFTRHAGSDQSGNMQQIRDCNFTSGGTARINNVRFDLNHGNINAGTLKLYGVS
jgi:uncharacterized protein (UPF0333 family)